MSELTDEQVIDLVKQVTGWTVHFQTQREPQGHFYSGHHPRAPVPEMLRLARALLASRPSAADQASAEPVESHHAQIGRELIASGLYDCMNDFETDTEARRLIERLIAIVEPILEAEWNRRAAHPAPQTVTRDDVLEATARIVEVSESREQAAHRIRALKSQSQTGGEG